MSLAYIRKAYSVPAQRGGRIRYTGEGRDEFGTILGASGAHLNIRLDGVRHGMPFHPTWEIEYLTPSPAPTGHQTKLVPSPVQGGMNTSSISSSSVSLHGDTQDHSDSGEE